MKNLITGYLLACFFILQSCVPAILIGTAATTAKVGSVISEERSLGSVIDDTTISTSIQKEFFLRGFSALFKRIKIQVREGRVLLTGDVASSEEIRKAVEICWSKRGVKEVLNELTIDPKRRKKLDLEQYTLDTWITGRVKARMLLNKTIKSVNYSVVTDENVVYIFGVALSDDELEKVCALAGKVRGVDRVVSYIRVKTQDLD